MDNATVLKHVRALILKHFGDEIAPTQVEAKKVIKAATFTGKTDPGGWARKAAVVIHCESGIPNGLYEESGKTMEKWFEISREMGSHFAEHVNGAVIGVYEM